MVSKVLFLSLVYIQSGIEKLLLQLISELVHHYYYFYQLLLLLLLLLFWLSARYGFSVFINSEIILFL